LQHFVLHVAEADIAQADIVQADVARAVVAEGLQPLQVGDFSTSRGAVVAVILSCVVPVAAAVVGLGSLVLVAVLGASVAVLDRAGPS
jgi:hypothetical protein